MGALYAGGVIVQFTLKKRRTLLCNLAVETALLFLSLIFLLPLFYMITTSLKSPQQIALYPPQWIPYPITLRAYAEGLSQGLFGRFAFNTVLTTLLRVLGTLLSSALCGFAFACLNAKGKNLWFLCLMATMMIPGTVTLIPMFMFYSKIGWVNTFLPLVVPAFLGGGAFNIFLLRQFFSSIPQSLSESARIDGCGWLRVLGGIYVPNAKPALIVVAIFTFVAAWNDYFGPLIYLTSPSKYTIAIGLTLFKDQYGGVMDTGPMMAMTFLSVLPVMLLYGFCQKYFVQGVVTSGMKM